MNMISKSDFVSNYFDRIYMRNFFGPSLSNLRRITTAHVQHIPFEYTWDPICKGQNLELDFLFKRIILFKSGGYCYETGLIFNNFLKAIGFNTQLVVGQIYRRGILDRTSIHLAIIVHMENDWLVDISWNGGISEPIALRTGEQHIQNKEYKISQTDFGLNVWEKEKNWKKIFFLSSLGNPIEIVKQKHIFHQFDKRSEFYGKNILKYSK